MKIIVVGGGAAGYFAAITAAEANPAAEVAILEQGNKVLSKVKISGGGRCNVTHACFEPRELVKYYPRGEKALLGPFHRFMTGDTMGWFADRGVELKIEEDGRVFPVSDSSQTIIDCFLHAARKAGITLRSRSKVLQILPPTEGRSLWEVHTKTETLLADRVLLASGSNTATWGWLSDLGHTIVEPVASLFTFNIKDERIQSLPGLSVPEAEVQVIGSNHLKSQGPLLVTHWGLSGPGVLRLSAWGARELHGRGYNFDLKVNWQAGKSEDDWERNWQQMRQQQPRRQVSTHPQGQLPTRLWQQLVAKSGIGKEQRWAELSRFQAQALASELASGRYHVAGKSTFKEEFVTCGGVNLNEVNFKTMESKLHPGLFFAGEVLDIDAITGGFNFQAAWTTGWIAGHALASQNP